MNSHLWLVESSAVIFSNNPEELIIKKLVIGDCFKKLLHGDEEASGSSKNDGHKQGDAQPQKLTLINHFHFLFGSWWSQSFMLTCINA